MATLHMDVDSCRNVSSTMGSAKDQLGQQVSALDSAINGMVGSSWIAPSATEFQSTYQEWASSMKQIMEQLATLQQRLNAEVADFEQAASKLA
jgi:WXG100 family type VII secretion target